MKVSTHHLTADAAQIDSSPRDQPLGEMTPEQLGALLERFSRIDPVKNHEFDPHLAVQTATDKFVVRTSAGKLYLYDGRDNSQPASELNVPGLLATFAGRAPAPREGSAEELIDLPPPNHSKQALGTALLAIGCGLNFCAVYVFLKPEPAEPAPVCQPITEANDLARLRDPLIGTYATGSNPGDRQIVIGASDSIQLQVVETNRALHSETTTGKLVRQEGHLAIALPGAGLILVQPDNSLLYFGDTYHPLARQ